MTNNIISVNIEVNDNQALGAIERVKEYLRSGDMSRSIGEEVMKWSQDRITSGENKAPDGSKWESLAASTLRRKRAKGFGHQGTLMQTGDLWSHIVSQAAVDSVSIGASMLYAWIHQEGGMAGRGRKVRIPARPYLGVSAQQRELLKEKVALWIKKTISG